MTSKEESLRAIGLSEQEIKVYLASLGLGSATVNQIAKESGVFRTYCYDILKSLMEQGLVNYVIKSGVKYFETAEPEKLVEILREREQEVRNILPELKLLRESTKEKPGVEFYEGKEGIKTIHEDIIREKPNEVVVCGNTQKHLEVMEWYFSRYVHERVENKIRARVITERSGASEDVKKNEKKELRQTRFFPRMFSSPVIKYVYKDKVALISMKKNPIGIIIKDQALAESELFTFEMLWAAAEKDK